MAFVFKNCLLTAGCLLLFSPFAQARHNRPDLAADKIPKDLKNDFTHAVLRYDSSYLNIQNLDDAIYTEVSAVTVLDKAGENFGDLYYSYSKLSEIDNLTASYYDADGKLIKKVSDKDFSDHSETGSDFVFNSDNRAKSYDYVSVTYPYTVVVTFKEDIKSILFLPDWQPQGSHRLSVAHSAFTLEYPQRFKVHTKFYEMPAGLKPSVQETKTSIRKTWEIGALPAFEEQPFSEKGNFNTPTLVIASDSFDLMGYQGTMDSWKDFGLFYNNLNKGRDNLDSKTIDIVKALVKKDTSVAQKVETLYHYMQQNTRYVANEYGLAGWQTFPAKQVCAKGYGDCKGLTNYLKSLLKAAGIPSYMTLANAGDTDYYKVNPAFPYNYFNHVILCVPNHQDTIWVECTSPVFQAGYLGGFTDNRYVLVCGPDGGNLVRTPNYGNKQNFLFRTTSLTLQPDSESQRVVLNNYYSGPMQDDLYMLLKVAPKDLIQRIIRSKFDFPSYEIDKFHYDFIGTHGLPAIREYATISATGIANKTGNRCFVKLVWLSNPMQKIIQTTPRTKPLVFDQSFTITDSVNLLLPDSYKVEYLPKNVHKNFPFATLQATFRQVGNKIIFTRKYAQHEGVYDVSYFTNYQNLYHEIDQQQNSVEMVLIRQSDSHEISHNTH